jgi:hypothetical protein
VDASHAALGWRLQDHTVTRHECGGDLRDRQVDGIVKGGDTQHNAQRHLYTEPNEKRSVIPTCVPIPLGLS